jgi:hypothetical protein
MSEPSPVKPDNESGGSPSEDEKRVGTAHGVAQHTELPDDQDRALVRKLDWRLIPWLCLLYLIAFLDRMSDDSR